MVSLYDNALFIRCWRERMRLHSVGAVGLITVIVIMLIFISVYLNPPVTHLYYSKSNNQPFLWLHGVFFYIAIAHGILLLFFGSVSASKIAFAERTNGTLDFHRSSPLGSFNQMLGIIFGAPVLEWVIFLCTLPIMLIITLITPIKMSTFIIFYASLIICSIFYHSLVVFAGISSFSKRQPPGIIIIFLLLYITIPLSHAISSMYHATWFPAYSFIHKEIMQYGITATSQLKNVKESLNLSLFFGYNIPFFIFQLIIQVPLIMFIWAVIARKISSAERSALSKWQSVLLAILILFYFIGSSVPFLSDKISATVRGFPGESLSITIFFYLVFFLMGIGAITATPTNLMYIKGLRRAKKLNFQRLGLIDDQSSNWFWLITFCIAISVMFGVFFYFIKAPYKIKVSTLAIILGQIVSFCSALEFFRLSRFHQKQIFFWIAIGFIWTIIPFIGLITEIRNTPLYLQYFLAASPLFDVSYLTSQFIGHYSPGKIFQAPVFLIINLFIAACMVCLAYMQRRKIQKTVLK